MYDLDKFVRKLDIDFMGFVIRDRIVYVIFFYLYFLERYDFYMGIF